MKSHSNLNLAVIVATDISLLALSWYVSHQLRFNFEIPNESRAILFRLFPFILMIKLVVFYLFDLYRGMWRYTSYTDLFKIIKATSVSSLVLVATIAFFYRLQGFSRAIFILDWILTIFLISGFRFSIRLFYCFSSKEPSARITSFCSLRNCFRGKQPSKRLLIIGAGDCGEKIFREIRDNSRLKYHLVGFIDDNEGKRGRQIHGVPILGTTEELEQIAGSTKTDEILIAIPTAAEVLMRSLVARCKKIGIPSKIAPSMAELIDGKVTFKAIRDVAYRDLLGREVIHLEEIICYSETIKRCSFQFHHFRSSVAEPCHSKIIIIIVESWVPLKCKQYHFKS